MNYLPKSVGRPPASALREFFFLAAAEVNLVIECRTTCTSCTGADQPLSMDLTDCALRRHIAPLVFN